MVVSHLIDSSFLQIKENGEVEVGTDGGGYDIGDVDHKELRPEHVHLGHDAHEGDGGHEGSHQGEGHGNEGHVAICHHVLLGMIKFIYLEKKKIRFIYLSKLV